MSVKSSKPKKQRKFFHSMPLHKKQKSLASTLSKALRKSMGKRALPLRKGDKVKILRGTHKGTEAKVTKTDYEKQQVFLEKLVRKKSDGTEIQIPLHASNLGIVDLDKSDARRVGKEEAAKKPAKEAEKEEKPKAKKAEEKKEKPKENKPKVKKHGKEGRTKKPKKA